MPGDSKTKFIVQEVGEAGGGGGISLLTIYDYFNLATNPKIFTFLTTSW